MLLFPTKEEVNSMTGMIRRRNGLGLIWAMIVMIALTALGSLAVDYGRVQLAKTQLLQAADAAARAACGSLKNGVSAAQNAAIQTAAANTCDGQPVTITAKDIEFGYFDTVSGTFTVLTGAAASNANAARVTAQRTTARGNPIPLTLAQILGQSTCDVTHHATAMVSPPYPGYIGIKLTRMFNTTRFDSYNSGAGAYSGSAAGNKGVLIGVKDLWLHDSCTVKGEAHWGPTGALTKDSGATVSPGPLSMRLWTAVYPPVDPGNAATVNNNNQIFKYLSGTKFSMKDGQGSITFPAGTYYFTQLDIGKDSTVLFNGPTTIYLDGSAKLNGTLANVLYRPYLLNIKVIGGGGVHVEAGATYAYIYAPQGSVHHHQTGQTYGSVISNLLCFRQTAKGHYDESGGPGGNIVSVR
jgi:Flp pilus assembly protein TadG